MKTPERETEEDGVSEGRDDGERRKDNGRD